jgi:hypothetical protein
MTCQKERNINVHRVRHDGQVFLMPLVLQHKLQKEEAKNFSTLRESNIDAL